jgi:hypothetical protein
MLRSMSIAKGRTPNPDGPRRQWLYPSLVGIIGSNPNWPRADYKQRSVAAANTTNGHQHCHEQAALFVVARPQATYANGGRIAKFIAMRASIAGAPLACKTLPRAGDRPSSQLTRRRLHARVVSLFATEHLRLWGSPKVAVPQVIGSSCGLVALNAVVVSYSVIPGLSANRTLLPRARTGHRPNPTARLRRG